MDGRVVLELVGAVEDAPAVVRAHHGELPVLAEVSGGDEACGSVHLVPQRHLLVRNVPQAELTVQGARQEVAVVLLGGSHHRYI